LLELEEHGVQCALIDGEQVAANLLDAASDAIAVKWAKDIEGLENHQGEGALEDIGFASRGSVHLGNQQEDATVPLGKQQETVGLSMPAGATALKAFGDDQGDVVVLLVGTVVADFVDEEATELRAGEMAVAAEGLE